MDFNEKYILENSRVRLSPLELSDIDSLIQFSEYEPELWEYSLVSAKGKEGLSNYIKNAVEARNQHKEYPFIVFDKKSNSIAGSTRFYDIQLPNKSLQLGFTWYGKKFQGTGLNQNCKYLLLHFAFEILKMERVELRADNNNQRSIAAMKSIGCKVEGILRKNGLRPDGTRRDSIILSILKEEWETEVKSNLESKISAIDSNMK